MKDEEIVVTSGLEHSLSLVLEALGLCGPAIALEEPCPAALWRLCGDASPLAVDRIPAGCRAAVVLADAGIPYGSMLSARNRNRLADWARGTGGHLIEIACDTVSRPELSGVPRLPGILIGGFDELLTPALGLGYAVLPRELAAEVVRLMGRSQPPLVNQLALESMLRDGTVTRLNHRLARLYERKRALVERILGIGSGTVNCAVLPGADGAQAQLLRRSVRVETLAPYYFSGAKPPPALVIGYGHVPDPVLERVLRTIAELLPRLGFSRRRPARRPPGPSYRRWE